MIFDRNQGKEPDIEFSDHKLILHSNALEELGLNHLNTYQLCFGSSCSKVYVLSGGDHPQKAYLSTKKAKTLHIPVGIPLNVWRKDKKLLVGPVVGVFMNPAYLNKLAGTKFPLSAQKYIQANRKAQCLIYFFSRDNVDWTTKKIRAKYFHPLHEKWKSAVFPFPDVLYDRYAGDQKNEKRILLSRQKFKKQHQIKQINSNRLEKWNVHQSLHKYTHMRKYLPQTVVYQSSSDVLRMFNRYGFIFLKSSQGSSGKQVISLQKRNNDYHIVFFEKKINKKIFRSWADVMAFIQSFKQNKQMIIQSGLHLIKYKERPLDVRVLLVKDHLGNWRAIYHQARVAKGISTITSYSLGGSLFNYSDLYSRLKKRYAKLPTTNDLTNSAIEIAKVIEKEQGSFGEIGMDMAIDTKGKIWFLEGNSKPTKNPVAGLEDTKGISPQFFNILQYSKYLVGANT